MEPSRIGFRPEVEASLARQLQPPAIGSSPRSAYHRGARTNITDSTPIKLAMQLPRLPGPRASRSPNVRSIAAQSHIPVGWRWDGGPGSARANVPPGFRTPHSNQPRLRSGRLSTFATSPAFPLPSSSATRCRVWVEPDRNSLNRPARSSRPTVKTGYKVNPIPNTTSRETKGRSIRCAQLAHRMYSPTWRGRYRRFVLLLRREYDVVSVRPGRHVVTKLQAVHLAAQVHRRDADTHLIPSHQSLDRIGPILGDRSPYSTVLAACNSRGRTRPSPWWAACP